MMNTRAGEIVPAAVISIGNMRGSVVGGEQHAFVAGNRRHRRQRVHALRARDARHELHREERRARRRERADRLRRAQRIGEADDRLPGSQRRRLSRRRAHLEHDGGRLEDLRARHDRCPLRAIRLVRESRRDAGALFDDDFETRLHQSRDRGRHDRHARFSRATFLSECRPSWQKFIRFAERGIRRHRIADLDSSRPGLQACLTVSSASRRSPWRRPA